MFEGSLKALTLGAQGHIMKVTVHIRHGVAGFGKRRCTVFPLIAWMTIIYAFC